MNNEIVIPLCTLLEVVRDKSWTMEGKTGLSASVTVRFGGKLLKIKADNTKKDFLDSAQANLDEVVDVVCEVVQGQNNAIQLRAIALKE